MEWISVAFGNAECKMAANMASKIAALITEISKTTDFSLFLHQMQLIRSTTSFAHKENSRIGLNVNLCA